MTTRKLSVEDQLEILSLYARYGRTVDGGDADGFVALFTADGSFTRGNSPPASAGGSGLPREVVKGRQALHDLIVRLRDVFKGKMRHQLTDICLEPGATADDAIGTNYGLITDWRDGPGKLAMHVTYRSTLRRTPEGWRFHDVALDILPKA